MIPRIRRIKAILRSLSSASRNNNYRKYFPDSLGRRSIPFELKISFPRLHLPRGIAREDYRG